MQKCTAQKVNHLNHLSLIFCNFSRGLNGNDMLNQHAISYEQFTTLFNSYIRKKYLNFITFLVHFMLNFSAHGKKFNIKLTE